MGSDDPPHDIQPESGPGTDFLCRVERLEDAPLRLAWYPWPFVDDLDNHAHTFHIRPDDNITASVDRVDRVVDEVGPHLVQLAAAPRYLGQVLLVLPPQGDVLQPGTEDGEGVLEAGDHIDLPDRRPVHVGVLLHRPDQLGDASRARPDLGGQGDEIQGRGEPPEAQGQRAVIEYLGQSLQAIRVHARRRQSRRHIPRLFEAVLLQPVGELILGVAQGERVEDSVVAHGRFALQGYERLAFAG